ncbi:hypothetical protein F1654_13045 [Alkalicaulis satelles]|uniref:Uncharacterized protein n=1 Tax=Alkalicaulis satelles TaxID=2609175 RepID=A0A5M6Z8L2_9PROT|nr:hypothetical protein [Alkalicaulis satelles]KAA5800982.1 hypothetical protein F1654_13045 [Alkalicaulis satelles]
MNETPDNHPARPLHPIRASGTLALIFLFIFIGLFIAFTFAIASEDSWKVIAGLGAGSVVMFALWARENHMAVTAPNTPRPARSELRTLKMMPVQVALVILYVGAVVASGSYAPQLSGFLKGMLQSLPIGLLAGWVVAFVYIIVESDEMVRRMHVLAVAIGAGATLLAATVWGLVTMHTGQADFASIYLFPAFAVFHSIASALVSRRFT